VDLLFRRAWRRRPPIGIVARPPPPAEQVRDRHRGLRYGGAVPRVADVLAAGLIRGDLQALDAPFHMVDQRPLRTPTWLLVLGLR
jgi:hypothetical protein